MKFIFFPIFIFGFLQVVGWGQDRTEKNRQSTLATKEKFILDCHSPKPLVLMHGIFSSAEKMAPLYKLIKRYCPDFPVFNIEIGKGFATSDDNLWWQTAEFTQIIHQQPELKGGFNLIGYSQGGLISRAYIQTRNPLSKDFAVETFIALASPQRGIYALPFPKSEIMRSLSALGQKNISQFKQSLDDENNYSLTQMWNDPLVVNDPKSFIKMINNEVEHPFKDLFRQNMLKLKEYILIKGEQEHIVNPKASSWMDFVTKAPCGEIKFEGYETTPFYKEDVIGLKSLTENHCVRKLSLDADHDTIVSNNETYDLLLKLLGFVSPVEAVRKWPLDFKKWSRITKVRRRDRLCYGRIPAAHLLEDNSQIDDDQKNNPYGIQWPLRNIARILNYLK